jgi:hypothetical protein
MLNRAEINLIGVQVVSRELAGTCPLEVPRIRYVRNIIKAAK